MEVVHEAAALRRVDLHPTPSQLSTGETALQEILLVFVYGSVLGHFLWSYAGGIVGPGEEDSDVVVLACNGVHPHLIEGFAFAFHAVWCGLDDDDSVAVIGNGWEHRDVRLGGLVVSAFGHVKRRQSKAPATGLFTGSDDLHERFG